MSFDVVILAGGLGTRLRSKVSDLPKCMAPGAGKPFLEHQLDYLARFSVEKVILSLGFLHKVVIDWVERNSDRWPFRIEWVVEEIPLGTGGGIRLALSKATSKNVCILNGDTFYNVDLNDFCLRHSGLGSKLSVALKPMQDFSRYGSVTLVGNTITEFREKQYCNDGLINGGIYCISLDSGLFDGLPDTFSFEKEIMEPGAEKGLVSGFVYDSTFIDIGIPEDFERAQEILS